MAINFTQTDTSNASESRCTPNNIGPSRTTRIATDGGTAGTGTPQGTANGNATADVLVFFRCTVNSGISWNSGTWTWRLNVTTANMNLTLVQVHICRIDGSDVSQATIGSDTTLSVSIGTTGVKSGTISGSAQTPNAGDYVMVVFSFSNGSMSNQSFNHTPNQNIDSPFTIPAAFIAKKPFVINQTIKRASYY